MSGNRPPETHEASDQTSDIDSAPVRIDALQLDEAAVRRIDRADQARKAHENRTADNGNYEPIEPNIPERDEGRPESKDDRQDPELERVQAVGRKGNSRPLMEDTSSSEDDKPEPGKPGGNVYFQDLTPHTYAQSRSDDARREGLGHISSGGQPVSKDDGRGAVAAAAVYADRAKKLDEQGVQHGRKIVEVDADTGLRTLGVLTALKRDNPEELEHKDFKAVVLSQNAEAIKKSGIFDIFGDRVEVVENKLDEPPKVPQGTLLALFTGTEHAKVHRLSKPANGEGKVIEAPSFTYLKGDDPLLTIQKTPDDTDNVRNIHAGKLHTFGTADSPDARKDFAQKIGPRIIEKPFDPRSKKDTAASEQQMLGSLSRQDTDVSTFMESWATGIANMRHYSPELEERTASVIKGLGSNGICLVDGPIRSGDKPMNWRDMSSVEGQVVSHVQESETFERGAKAADRFASVFFPPSPEGSYNYGIIDRGHGDLRASSERELSRIVTAQGNQNLSRSILENARTALEATRGRNGTDVKSAVDDIKRQYDAYVDSAGLTLDPVAAEKFKESGLHGHALPGLDGDLARELAKTLREHGHYQESIDFADKAITAAPHVDAAARVEKAKALIMQGLLDGNGTETEQAPDDNAFVRANRELAQAMEISPNFVELHKTRAQLAVHAEQWNEYSDALSAIMHDSPQIRDPRNDPALDPALKSLHGYVHPETGKPVLERAGEAAAVVNLVAAKLRADGWAAEQANRNQAPLLLRRERIRRDEHGSWVMDPGYDEIKPGTMLETRMIDAAPKIASTLHGHLIDVAPDRRQWQDKQLEPLMQIIRKYMPEGVTHADMRQQTMELTGDAARLAAEFEKSRVQLTPGELILHQGAERQTRRAEGVSFPGAVKDWDTKDIISSLELYFTNTAEHRADLGQPFIIQGESNAGKTTLAQSLIKKTVEQGGLKAWIWDVGERAQHRNIHEILGEDVRVAHIRFGNGDYPLVGLSLLEPEPGFPVQPHLRLAMMALLFATSAEEPFPQLTGAAAQNLMSELGHAVRDDKGRLNLGAIDPEEAGIASFDEYVQYVLDKAGIYGEKGEVGQQISGFLSARLNDMQSGVVGPHIDSVNAIDMADLDENYDVVHPDFSDVTNPQERKFLMALFYMRRMEYDMMKRQNAGDIDLPLESIDWVEEAQKMFGSAQSADSPEAKLADLFSGIARQTRGYGRGLVPIVQSAEQISSDMRDNAGVIFVGFTQSVDTRKALLNGFNIKEDSDRFNDVAELDQGNFLVAKSGTKPVLANLGKSEKSERPAVPVDFKVRNGLYTPDGRLPTINEIDAAERKMSRNDMLQIYMVTDTLARLTGNQLPAMPEEVRRDLEEMSDRERALVMQLAARKAVSERSADVRKQYNVSRLATAVYYDAAMSLAGVPLAGRSPGTELVMPELAVAGITQSINNPYAEKPIDPNNYVPYPAANVPGLDKAIAAQQAGGRAHQRKGAGASYEMPRAGELRQALSRIPAAIEGNNYRVAANQATVIRTILGSDNGESLFTAMQRVTDYHDNEMEQWLEVSEKLGLWKKGDPTLPWFAEQLNIVKETMHAAKSGGQQVQRAAGSPQQGPSAGASAAQQPQLQANPQQAPQTQPNAPARTAETSQNTSNENRVSAIQEAVGQYDRFANGTEAGDMAGIRNALTTYIYRRQIEDPSFAERLKDPTFEKNLYQLALTAQRTAGRDGLLGVFNMF